MKKIKCALLWGAVSMLAMLLLVSCDRTPSSVERSCEHHYSEAVLRKATCTEEGMLAYRCSFCGDSYTQSLAAGHTWVEADCARPKACTVCGLTEGEALGHTTEAGMCDRCHFEIFDTRVYSGTGDTVITGIDLPAGSYCATLAHTGKQAYSYFSAKFYYGEDRFDYQLLDNTMVGTYCGIHALYGHGGNAVRDAMIQVDADGDWTISLHRISEVCTTNLAGEGSTATGLIPIAHARNVIALSHTGSSSFVVDIYKENGDRWDAEQVANEKGDYRGQRLVTLEPGCRYYFVINADGAWTIDFGLGEPLTDYKNTCSNASK